MQQGSFKTFVKLNTQASKATAQPRPCCRFSDLLIYFCSMSRVNRRHVTSCTVGLRTSDEFTVLIDKYVSTQISCAVQLCWYVLYGNMNCAVLCLRCKLQVCLCIALVDAVHAWAITWGYKSFKEYTLFHFFTDLRKKARQLENEIDLKLVSFSKLGTNYSHHNELDSSR